MDVDEGLGIHAPFLVNFHSFLRSFLQKIWQHNGFLPQTQTVWGNPGYDADWGQRSQLRRLGQDCLDLSGTFGKIIFYYSVGAAITKGDTNLF